MALPTHLQVIHSYRHMYRALLKAVHYSKPARYVARDQIRGAYRKGTPSQFDTAKIDRTLQFLNGATQHTGMEHKILRNLLFTRYSLVRNARFAPPRNSKATNDNALKAAHIKSTAYLHYDMTLAMLNDSMGLCLR